MAIPQYFFFEKLFLKFSQDLFLDFFSYYARNACIDSHDYFKVFIKILARSTQSEIEGPRMKEV